MSRVVAAALADLDHGGASEAAAREDLSTRGSITASPALSIFLAASSAFGSVGAANTALKGAGACLAAAKHKHLACCRGCNRPGSSKCAARGKVRLDVTRLARQAEITASHYRPGRGSYGRDAFSKM